MTSDAKIGLLLGLVFIFIIAFIINGLPSLGQANNPNQLTTNMVNSQNGNSVALGSDERQLQRRIIRPAQTASAQNSSAQTPDSSLRPASANITQRQQQNDQVRFTLPLTDDSQIQQASQQAVQEQQVQRAEPTQARQSTHQRYTVRSGDNLASIAKQVYGQVLGNKRENIDRIFQANSDNLSSPDRIVVGQELIIPPLDDEHFEAVSSVGRRHDTSAQAPRPAPTQPQPRTYTVRSGDSLWTIAQRQLGDGNRYKEIQDLNERALANPSTIKPGDTILIPAN